MKIIFFGTPSFVLPILETLKRQHEIIAVVTNPDQKTGRKQLFVKTPVKIWAEQNNIKVLTPEKLDRQFMTNIIALKPDLFIVTAYGKIIPKYILEIPTFGAINIHPYKLPKYRGPSPLQNLIIDGENKNYISFIKMDEQMDHGPIIFSIPFSIKDNDTFISLAIRVFQEATKDLLRILDSYMKNEIEPIPQDELQSTYCLLISRQSGYIDLSNPPAKNIFSRMIRAYYPWPGVWTKWEGKIIKFFPEQKIQMEGKNIVNYKTFVEGYPKIKPLLDQLIFEEPS